MSNQQIVSSKVIFGKDGVGINDELSRAVTEGYEPQGGITVTNVTSAVSGQQKPSHSVLLAILMVRYKK